MADPEIKWVSMSEPKIVVIDPDGDVLLLVGKKTAKASLQVSSKVLSVTSTVFKAMFSRNLKEGNGLAASFGASLCEVPLLDDNAHAMITLCHVLHLRTSELVPVNDISKLKKFAAVADKYDCKHASMFFGRVWLERIECKTEDLIDLLILAHNFDDHQTFVRASKLMVDALSVRRIVQDFQKADSRLPSIIYDRILEKRTELETDLSQSLLEPLTDIANGDWEWGSREIKEEDMDQENTHGLDSPDCNEGTLSHAYICELSSLGLWPVVPQDWHIVSAFNGMMKFSMRVSTNHHTGEYMGCCKHCCKAMNDHINWTRLCFQAKMKKGLCLDCFVAGSKQSDGTACRIKHCSVLKKMFGLG